MSEDIIMSIKPKWFDLIASGKKTIELRKSRPMRNYRLLWFYVSGTGQVKGSAIVTSVFEIDILFYGRSMEQQSCVPLNFAASYAGQNPLYAWRIENFQPVSLPLSAFGLKRPPMSWRYVSSIDGDHLKEVQE